MGKIYTLPEFLTTGSPLLYHARSGWLRAPRSRVRVFQLARVERESGQDGEEPRGLVAAIKRLLGREQ